MSNAISVQSLSKRFGDHQALDRVSFEVPKGAVVGLIGPNGAGKTTALKAILGLSAFEGAVEVLGQSPRSAPHQMMTTVGYISDVGILPRWLKVSDALKFTQAIHPQFDLAKARGILAKTDIPLKQRVKALSKGMVTQLHLALVLAMDVQLLILDEPTLGLDIVYRSQFYQQILNEFLGEDRTLLISTHQVEEIESLLTHLIFIDQGKIRLDATLDDVYSRYRAVEVVKSQISAARGLKPLSEQAQIEGACMIFDGVSAESLADLGTTRRVGIAELFVAMMTRETKLTASI